MKMDNDDLLAAVCATQNARRGPITSKDRAVLKWLGVILGVVVALSLGCVIFAYSLL